MISAASRIGARPFSSVNCCARLTRILISIGTAHGYARRLGMESTPPILFDRARLRKRRLRAAAHFAQADFLWHEATARAEESMSYIARSFPRILAFGGHALSVAPGTTIIHAALAPMGITPTLIADEECLPFTESSFDAVISLLTLHWVNDLPGTLAQIHRILKPDGLFLAILPGGETLRELRSVLATTESEQCGGVTPRVAPFLDVRDGGALLQRAGFALPVADSELFDVSYPHLFALMDDLRKSGEVNMLQQQVQHFTPRNFFTDAAARYAAQHSDAENRITATVEFITLTGWKPSATQQQPAQRGSGKMSLKDILN
ncbi:MAG: methyltransferase domain-containing protein [Rickettsiales bacterium]